MPEKETLYLMGYVGGATLLGLLCAYAALSRGAVSVVVPIISAEGAVTAALAWFAGDVPSPTKLIGMLVVVGSVVTLVALSPTPVTSDETARSDRLAALAAVLACVLLGSMLFAQGKVAEQTSIAWSVLPSRLVPVLLLAIPLAAAGRLKLPVSTFKLVVATGLTDVAATCLVVIGSRQDIAVTTVLTCQYSVVAVLLAALLFGERLRAGQKLTVAVLVCGVAVVAASSSS